MRYLTRKWFRCAENPSHPGERNHTGSHSQGQGDSKAALSPGTLCGLEER